MRIIEIFGDVLCPFTYAGLAHLVAERDQRDVAVTFVVRAWPLELVNGAPLDARHVAAEIEGLRASVAADRFRAYDPATFATRFPTSGRPAFAVALAANATGDAALAERVALALREAVFEDGRDIGDTAVAAEIACRHGIEPLERAAADAAMRADWAEGRARGVQGSPQI